MNAKLAVAISLGASSLALFGMANVANAETATTTDTGANPPVVKPINDDPVEKAKGEANKAIEDAKTQKETVTKEVEDAESEAKDANSKAIDANNEVTEAQKDLKDKQKEANTAEEQKTAADKELADQKTAVDNADKEVKATQAAFDKETANQTAAENKLNKTKDEKGKVEGELNTEKEAVKAKTTELANAGNTVKDEQGKLDTAKGELEKAKQDKKQAQEKANQLSDAATQKENEHKAAEQAVKENTQHQENIQKQIDNLNAAGSGTTNAEVQDLEKKANEAKQAYDQANTTAAQEAQDAQKAADDIKTKHTALTNAEDELKNKNASYAGLLAKVTSAEGEAAKKAATYDAAYKNAPKDDIPVEQKSDFYKFLQYVIDTESKKENKNTNLIEDAKRAQKVLKGETYVVPEKILEVKKTTKQTPTGTITETVKNILPGYTAYAPTWYNDLVKPGLGRVGSADSLENMKQAATYYKALDDYRQKDVPGMKTVKVRLTFIAESIVHSFYSAAIIGHAACHDTMGSKTPDELKTHAYNTNVAENVAWDADYNDYDSNRPKQDLKQCNTNNGHLSCTYEGNKKHNALDAWYGLEKQIYDKALKDKKWNNHEFTEDGLTALKDHRTDFGTYLGNHPNLALFKDDSNGETKNLFKNVVGHYTNFSANNNFASGFAKADNSNTKMLGYEDIAVWHGGNEESSISIDEYNKLLNDYAGTVKSNTPSLSDEEAENLKKLNADANSANMAVFDAKYDALTAKHNMSNTDRSAVEALENKITEASKNFKKARDNASAANKAKEEAAEKAAELQTAWTTANSAYKSAKQKAENDAQLGKEARQQQINQLTTELNGLKETAKTLKTEAETAKQTAKTARTAAKAQQEKVDVEFTKDVNEAQVRFDTATKAVKEANANKAKVDKELQAANEKVNGLTKKIGELTTQIESENQKVENAKSEVQAAQVALQGAKDTQNTVTTQLKALQTKAQNADETVKNTKAAVEVAKKAVVEKIKLAQTAVTNAQAKVQHAKEVAEAAKTKIETIKKNLATKQVALAATITDTSAKAQLNSIFMSATGEFESFVQILTGKVSTLQTTATNLTKSATALNDQLQKVAPESVVTPPVVPPAPKPPVVVPSHDGESGHGSTGNTGSTNNTGNTENAGNTGNSNVPFTPQAPHVSVPAVDVEQQSNEFASATAENHVTQAVAKSEAGKPTKAERANAKNTKHSNHTASANAAATSSAGVAQSKNAKDSKNAESKESAKKDSAKQETQDSNSNSSDQNNTTNNTPSNESKNAQANGNAAKAQNSSNNTLTIGAVVAVVIAGIVAIGGGVTFARHRRM